MARLPASVSFCAPSPLALSVLRTTNTNNNITETNSINIACIPSAPRMAASMPKRKDNINNEDDSRALITHRYGLRAHICVSDSGDGEAIHAARQVWAHIPPPPVVHPEVTEESEGVYSPVSPTTPTTTAEEDITTAAGSDEEGWGAEDCVAVARINGVPVGAGRIRCTKGNAAVESVYVLPRYRGEGIGRTLVRALLSYLGSNNNTTNGATYVYSKADSLGFYSLLGFEVQGRKLPSGNTLMILRVPQCASPSDGHCIGLHHTSMRVLDIERSLAFYGSIGFFVTDKFLTANASRACFIEGLGVRLELVESPNNNISNNINSNNNSNILVGFDRLVFDVTRACIDLDGYIEHLRRRNGGFLNVRGPTATQVVGKYVVSVATVEDVDGIPIEFIRRESIVPSSLRTRVKW